ncbi:hypothetical protein [Candidatus Palauibacter sp.]|uniref:hypothetical protein n=1 Tax=Candidatus Palauibacter sp. TaxID=3101350 RepID=UPI003B5CAC35
MDDPQPRRASPQDHRRVGLAVAGFYVLLFVALVWPVYPFFATIEPRVLAMPFSLFYVVVCLLLSFFALFAFYLWERKRDAAETGAPADGDAGAAGGGRG